jgi:(S)-2-hydroxyglutarate dehydrogenase
VPYPARVPGSSPFDAAVVGGGIVGLATARELQRRDPRARIVVLEAAPAIGTGQTGHNSGVVHAGIPYAPGSLKARLCRRGAALTEAYCHEHGLPFERSGQLIVALTPSDLPRLDALHERGTANGVPGLRRLAGDEIAEVEPHAVGLAALHSPSTATADFGAVARRLAEDVREAGGEVRLSHPVRAVRRVGGVVELAGPGEAVRARRAVACAGAGASRIAQAAGGQADPRIVPFRGGYGRLRPSAAALVRGLIYPVADPALPFLGVHLTRHVDGEVTVGPTALLTGGLTWPGTWRVLRRWWRTGAGEVRLAASTRALAAAAARLVPAIGPDDVARGPAGTRAQAVARDGSLLDDFAFDDAGGVLHVRNAPSPAATAALAIAEVIADRLD